MGALTKDVSETTSKIRQMEARVTSIESDLIKLGLLRNELQLTKSQLQDVEARVERNEMKNGIYFDAYRLENIKLYFDNYLRVLNFSSLRNTLCTTFVSSKPLLL